MASAYDYTQDPTAYSFGYDHVQIAPEQQIEYHNQPSWELSAVVSGRGMRIIGDTIEPFGPGDVVLIPPGIAHCWQFDPESVDSQGCIENYSISFITESAMRISNSLPELKDDIMKLMSIETAVTFGQGHSEMIISAMRRMECDDQRLQAVRFADLLYIISTSDPQCVAGRLSNVDRSVAKLARVKTFIICNYTRQITLADAASYVGMNRSAFCVFLRRVAGSTFVEMLNRHRIAKASAMLQQSSLPVAEIAWKCGFNSIPYFNRLFKQSMGENPSQYRAHSAQDSTSDNNLPAEWKEI